MFCESQCRYKYDLRDSSNVTEHIISPVKRNKDNVIIL